MKCASPDKVRKLALKQKEQMIHDTAKWSVATAVWILFEKFHWTQGRVNYFLRRYDEQSDMVAPEKERWVSFYERSKEGYTFSEIRQEVEYDIALRHRRADADGKVEKEVGYLQDNVLQWILDLILNTLKNKCGWHESMCRKFASYYDSAIPTLDTPAETVKRLTKEMQEKYGYTLEVTVK